MKAKPPIDEVALQEVIATMEKYNFARNEVPEWLWERYQEYLRARPKH